MAKKPEKGPEAGSPSPASPVVVGVDPGKEGGIAVLDLDGNPVLTRRMPLMAKGNKEELDGVEFARLVRELAATRGVSLVAVEEVTLRPREGPVGALTAGLGAGRLEGIVEGNLLPVRRVKAQVWMKDVLAGTARPVKRKVEKTGDKDADEKAARKAAEAHKKAVKANTIAFCKRRWPSADLKGSTHHSATDNDGIADALAIAEYARQLVRGPAGR